MTKIIWLISFIATIVGSATMNHPSKTAYYLTCVMFGVAGIGAIVLIILLFGGPIYL